MCNITATFIEVIAGEPFGKDSVTRVQHRDSVSSPWKPAKIGDVLREGASVRTSAKAGATLRLEKTCGCDTKSGIVNIGGATFYTIPAEVPDKDTTVQSESKVGRADFKVDKGGFANDFKVITPSTILAVRG